MDDHARFERLYQGYAGAVLTFARRRTSPNEAEDVVAEVFLAAWRRLEEASGGDPLPWLLGIAWGVLSHRRRGAERSSALIARLREVEPTVSVGDEAWTPDGRVLQALRTVGARRSGAAAVTLDCRFGPNPRLSLRRLL